MRERARGEPGSLKDKKGTRDIKVQARISLKITFLKILTRATIAPAQWDCEGERLPVGKQKQIFTLK